MEIWHNPSCSKSRAALAAAHEAGLDPVVRRYLDDAPSVAELSDVLDRLGLQPWQLARPAETTEAGITLPRDAEHRADWIAALAQHPRAIQRPVILTDDGSAVVARDPEAVARALSSAR